MKLDPTEVRLRSWHSFHEMLHWCYDADPAVGLEFNFKNVFFSSVSCEYALILFIFLCLWVMITWWSGTCLFSLCISATLFNFSCDSWTCLFSLCISVQCYVILVVTVEHVYFHYVYQCNVMTVILVVTVEHVMLVSNEFYFVVDHL